MTELSKMHNDMSYFLFQFTDTYDFIALILCFVVFVIFLLRLNTEHLIINRSTVTKVNHSIETPVVGFHNPFFITLSSSKSSLQDGVHLQFSFLKHTDLYIYWDVNIKLFYEMLQQPLTEILTNLQNNEYLDVASLCTDHKGRYEPCQSLERKFQPSMTIAASSLGNIPRERYPLVLLTVNNDAQSQSISDSPQVVLMFTIVHLKDSVCNNSSHIVGQYIKSSDNRVCYLQPLFESSLVDNTNDNKEDSGTTTLQRDLSEGDRKCFAQSDTLSDTSPSNGASSTKLCKRGPSKETGECVICQNDKAIVAFLPCRHTCVCDKCLKKLDRCPMCRGYVMSYFRINSKEESEELTDSDEEIEEVYMGNNWWERLNARINLYLGFT